MRDVDGESFRLLFVCTGNTCRSPLAAAIARSELAALGWTCVEVRSAGTSALDGLPASEGSLGAAERHGLGDRERAFDLARHGWAP